VRSEISSLRATVCLLQASQTLRNVSLLIYAQASLVLCKKVFLIRTSDIKKLIQATDQCAPKVGGNFVRGEDLNRLMRLLIRHEEHAIS
jgi:hypothetical protein